MASVKRLIRARWLLDVHRGEMVPDPLVVVADGRIREILPRAMAVARSSDHRVLAFSGGCILPGLINAHLHLCAPSRGVPFYRRQSDRMALLWAVRNARAELAGGVTTARDCGGQHGVLFRLRRAMATGICQGPRLQPWCPAEDRGTCGCRAEQPKGTCSCRSFGVMTCRE